MKNYKKFIESAEIIRDYNNNPYDNNLAYYDDSDAIAFGYYDGKLYIGNDCSDYHCDLNYGDPGEREELEYPGRLWYEKKLISFYEYPSKEKLPKVLKDIKKEMYKINDIKIDWNDGWLIEIYFPAFNKNYYWDDFEDDPDNYINDIKLVPISKYTGSKNFDINNIPPHLMKPDEKIKYLKDHGYKPKTIKTPKKMTQAEYRNKVTKYKYTESFNEFKKLNY